MKLLETSCVGYVGGILVQKFLKIIEGEIEFKFGKIINRKVLGKINNALENLKLMK